MPDVPIELVPLGATSSLAMADMVEAAGTERLGDALMGHLHSACGADYCAAFRVDPQAPCEVATGGRDGAQTAHARVEHYLQRACWSKDPAVTYAKTQLRGFEPMLMRMDIAGLGNPQDREVVWPRIHERVVIAGRSRRGIYSISVLREGRGAFTSTEIERVGKSADLLISVLAKHADLIGRGPTQLGDLIRSLVDIETCIKTRSNLTQREAEVCARILYGLTTTGIALDLGISNETVKTFRKLAYRRLHIGSERELLQWYLGLQHRWLAEH